MNPNLWQSQARCCESMLSVAHGSLWVGVWVIQFETLSKIAQKQTWPMCQVCSSYRYASHCICALQRHSLTSNTHEVLACALLSDHGYPLSRALHVRSYSKTWGFALIQSLSKIAAAQNKVYYRTLVISHRTNIDVHRVGRFLAIKELL